MDNAIFKLDETRAACAVAAEQTCCSTTYDPETGVESTQGWGC